MSAERIRQLFLEFFKKKGHTIVPSSSLIPDDPSVLLTTAGMQQFKSYYTNEKSPYGDNVVSIQKCFRTSDIDEVGDESHLTFFEMLGNFSFGGYFKEEAIKYAYEFITQELGLEIDYVSVFGGDKENKIPADEGSEKIWKEIDARIEIKKAGKEDNFWGPTGDEGPCGPTTEIYVNGVEIWNIVFNEYYRTKEGKFTKLEKPGVDTGMGLERLAMVAQGKNNVFETDLFNFIIEALYKDLPEKTKRIIADHSRGIVFLAADGIRPSNKERGYVLRRLMRRVIVYAYDKNIKTSPEDILELVINNYVNIYPNLDYKIIKEVYKQEYVQLMKSIGAGLRELEKIKFLDGVAAFRLYETFGIPFEIIKEKGREKAKDLKREEFEEELKKHQELSRTASAGMFKSGLADTGQQATKYHTATHLLLAALRQVLGEHVLQKGSNITSERLRFDFSHPQKLSSEQIKQVEDLVNEKIKEDLPVKMEEMDLEEAKKQGAMGVFEAKYADKVKVYTMGKPKAFSKEICAGPHVQRTGELGHFKIIKEEASSSGVRRVKAILE